MAELPYEVWRGAWAYWGENRKIAQCEYCGGIHPPNEICAAEVYRSKVQDHGSALGSSAPSVLGEGSKGPSGDEKTGGVKDGRRKNELEKS